MWFLSAQISAWLQDDSWLRAASHSDAMASLLDQQLRASGVQPLYPVEGNMVFVEMSEGQSDNLNRGGFLHYFGEQPEGASAARFVTSHDTCKTNVDALGREIVDALAHV